MGDDEEWGPKGLSTQHAERLGLTNPRPFIGTTISSGDAIYYFESNGKQYVRNAMDSSIYLIQSPTGKDKIIDLITQGKEREIKVKEVKGYQETKRDRHIGL